MNNSKSDTYVLAVGEQGRERLNILNEIVGPASQNWLVQSGLGPGQHVLEIGCGTGNMSCWISEKIGKDGHLYAVDISKEQLDIARKQAAERNLHNITFVQSSVFDLKDLPLFDLIYSRFILIHISDAFFALQIMLRYLKPGGFIVSEESTNSVSFCYPKSPLYHRNRQLYLELGARKGVDLDLGEKLYSYYRKLNLKNIHVNFSQPIYKNRHQKLLIPLGMTEMKKSILKEKLATESEIDQLITELFEFIKDDNYLIALSRITQICASI